jgi:hypothetical protein
MIPIEASDHDVGRPAPNLAYCENLEIFAREADR